MRAYRKERGGAIAITVVLTLLLTILGLGFMQLTMAMTGAAETRNATDAGALNVGRQAVTIKVDYLGADEKEFEDVADSDGKFGLPNVNRAWAEAMLAAINIEAMRAEGQSTAMAERHADALYEAAGSLSKRLADKLNNQNNLHGMFEAFAESNSVKMLGKTASVKADAGARWQTAFVNRGVESNISFDAAQLPPQFDVSLLRAKSARDGKTYLPGYMNLNILGHDFAFVPFEDGGRPQLISNKRFKANDPDQSEIPVPVNAAPNAFSVASATVNAETRNQEAMAFVMTHTRQKFHLRKPHGFVRIKLNQPEFRAKVNQFLSPPVKYSFFQSVSFITPPVQGGDGAFISTTQYGNEFRSGTLANAMFLGGADKLVMAKITQRMKEVKPDFTQKQLADLLERQKLSVTDNEYFIYPNQDGEIVISAKGQVIASWLHADAGADGAGAVIARQSGNGEISLPVPLGGTYQGYENKTTLYSRHTWQPGSGFGGCLGELTVSRGTNAAVRGIVIVTS